ncbi:methyltransferase domain-containing protein [Candidatus Berkiella aquae]|uniref:Methyltransferase domain-containing protein n=1 Tax=Candidatus Berkiella aquae TaxID=295108 RepID=A0A0Q9YLU7_9GAMM|nr:methyltransferase domain-containing protein [Candidatus Berkiella aquae]MCS5711604.1 methyltransferase domain-containing protein [Candidatus Berkiella aquae]
MNTPPSIHAEWASHLLSKIDLSDHRSILDLGCRQGKTSAHLAKQYPKQLFLAVDNQASEIEQATEHQLPNLQFALQDARKLCMPEQFDAVISLNNCFMWIKEKQTVFNNLYNALKPQGKTYLQFFVRHGHPKNDRFLSHAAKEIEWRSYFKNYSQDYYDVSIPDVCRMLCESGFIIHKLELMKYGTYFKHPDLLEPFFKSWASQIKYLPIHRQDHFLHRAMKHYLNFYHYNENESFYYDEYVLEVICEKPFPVENNEEISYQYGAIEFSQREAQVIKHFLNGKAAKEIGALLDISAKTVEFHLASIKEKCHCRKRSELFQIAIMEGFIHLMFDNKL